MYLKQLELFGFKSFGQKSVLEFSSPITAIVGPNGSGKSNIAEAFRFVLGEQSIKSMRGKKGEDLIFNGAEAGGRSNRAGVKVTFDNKKRFLALDVDEVTIERIVFRDGTNEYSLNGSNVRLKDILELLSTAHIGQSGHHIISQGEADRILNSNPKERKSIIEDALGLKSYQYKKNESQKKLEKTEENIKEVELMRREIAPHIRFLKKQVEKIEQAMAMRIELSNLYNEYLRREKLYLEKEAEELKTQFKEPLDLKKQLEEKLSIARKVLQDSKKEDEKSKEFIAIDQELAKIRQKKSEITREIGRVEGEISSLSRILEQEKRKQESEDHKMIRLSSVAMLYRQIENIGNENGENSSIEKLISSIKQIKTIIADFLSSQKDDIDNSHIADFSVQIENRQTEKKVKEDLLLDISKQETLLGEKYEKIKSEIEAEKDSNRDAEKAVFQIKAELNHIETVLSELGSRQSRYNTDKESFESEVREAIVLVGQAIKNFSTENIKDQSGNVLSENDILAEVREMQSDRRKKLEKLKIRLEDAGAGSGDEILKEYEDVTMRDQFLLKELEDLHKSSESLNALILDLENRIDAEFKEGIKKINTEFGKFFALMFGGGTSNLSVVKREKRKAKKTEDTDIESTGELETPEEDEEEEGVEIAVSLPRKKIKSLMMLSGGERALTSIALLFAMSQVNPPPFVILDETDAALDEANSRKYGDMIANLSEYSQLILITHNRETMSRAGVLYGVTMSSNGVSKLLSIAFDEAVKVAK